MLRQKVSFGSAEIASFCSCFFRKLLRLNPEARAKYLAIQPSGNEDAG